MQETYLPTDAYYALIARLLTLSDALDPENEAKLILGEELNVWPKSIRKRKL